MEGTGEVQWDLMCARKSMHCKIFRNAIDLVFLSSILRVPLQRLFHLPGGEFKGIFLADWSEQCRAVLNLILLDWFGLHEPFYGPGQCF